MEDAMAELDAVEERCWSRRSAVARAMADRCRSFFTVHLSLAEDDEGQQLGGVGEDVPEAS